MTRPIRDNPKTSTMGAAAIFAALVIGIWAIFDNDPETVADPEKIGIALVALLAGLKGLFAKDG